MYIIFQMTVCFFVAYAVNILFQSYFQHWNILYCKNIQWHHFSFTDTIFCFNAGYVAKRYSPTQHLNMLKDQNLCRQPKSVKLKLLSKILSPITYKIAHKQDWWWKLDNAVQRKCIHFHEDEEEEQTEKEDVKNEDAPVPQHVSQLLFGPNCYRKPSAIWKGWKTACVFSCTRPRLEVKLNSHSDVWNFWQLSSAQALTLYRCSVALPVPACSSLLQSVTGCHRTKNTCTNRRPTSKRATCLLTHPWNISPLSSPRGTGGPIRRACSDFLIWLPTRHTLAPSLIHW